MPTLGLGDNPKYIAESVTHEVGHTLGLSHAGTSVQPYYIGSSGWAPIMGAGFFQPITQWSHGEYLDSNNTEDEYAVMLVHGIAVRSDEDSNTEASARTISENSSLAGVISTPSDIDYFKFTPTTTDSFVISVKPATLSPNLDLTISFYPKSAPKDASFVNDPISVISYDDAQGLSATISRKLNLGTEYIIAVQGSKIPFDGGSSNYGSVGIYSLSVIRGAQQSSQSVSAPQPQDPLAIKPILPVDVANASATPQKMDLPTAIVKGMKFRYIFAA